jgi:hypothetical protein
LDQKFEEKQKSNNLKRVGNELLQTDARAPCGLPVVIFLGGNLELKALHNNSSIDNSVSNNFKD